jgi:hypothetical protein
MFIVIFAVVAVVAALGLLVREVRGAGYGRAAVPSITQTGAERTAVLREFAESSR